MADGFSVKEIAFMARTPGERFISAKLSLELFMSFSFNISVWSLKLKGSCLFQKTNVRMNKTIGAFAAPRRQALTNSRHMIVSST